MAIEINDVSVALAVIKEAQAGGFEVYDPPENRDELVERAQEWYEEAQKEYIRGVKHPSVVAIVNLVEGQLEQGNTAVADKEGEEPDPALAAVESTYPRRSSGGLSESDEREASAFLENEIESLNLPLPKELENPPEPMPIDLSSVPDKKIRYLSGHYNAYLNRARWLLAVASSDLSNANHLRERALRKAFKKVHADLVRENQRPTKDVVTSFAEEDEEVISWSEKVKDHQEHVTAYKTLVEIYSSNVDRLSREWTMRQNEWERTR